MKKMNKKGFTLMEMLIVIAIIAILIAIAIPTFTAALEKSRQKTDLANIRALKSLVVAAYMADEAADATLVSNVNSATASSPCVVYLNKDGQTYLTAATDLATKGMKITAKDFKSVNNITGATAGYIALAVNNKCVVVGSNPDLGNNLPS